MKPITRTKAVCPFCGEQNDAATPVASGVPKVGDVSICLYCQQAGIFAKDDGHLIVRKPNAKEWVELSTSPVVIQTQIMIASLNIGKHKPDENC
jgi:hypothetical protein